MKMISGAILFLTSAVFALGSGTDGLAAWGLIFAPVFFLAGMWYMVEGEMEERRSRRGR